MIINFCYTGKIVITEENIKQIVWTASTMGFVYIEQKCKEFWRDNLTVSNCVEIHVLADKFGFLELHTKSRTYICVMFQFVPKNDLLHLQFSILSKLLQCDEIQASEDSIFTQLLMWVEHSQKNRARHVSDLLKSIRMEKLSKEVRRLTAIILNLEYRTLISHDFIHIHSFCVMSLNLF